jgi:hypothetical protein
MFVVPPLQMAVGETGFTTGFGLTVCTILTGALGQPLAVAVTMYVTVPFPVKVWAMLLPEPADCPVTLPVNVPIVQLNNAPPGVLVSAMLVVPPLQMAVGETGLTDGEGLTVCTMLTGVPVQPLKDGVTTYVTVPFPVKVWAMLLPEPADWPVTLPVTVPMVQLNEAPPGVLVSAIFVVPPLQIAVGDTGLTEGGPVTD